MSDFTGEITDVIVDLADELGEGLTATFYETASERLDPDANEPGASSLRTFNPATQSYDEDAALAAGGVVTETAVKVPPGETVRADPRDAQGTVEGRVALTTPPIIRGDGSRLIPAVGMRVGYSDRFWQIVRVDDIVAGNGISGHKVTLGGGGI